jgi:rRNA-processing protein FCF1
MAFDRIRGDKIRKTVILDSSALLSFFEFPVDWEKELCQLVGTYRLVVPSAVVQELQILAKRTTGQKKAAAALKLVSKLDTIDMAVDSADEACIKIAEKVHGIVVTNDMALREQLKNRSIPVIFLRGKKKLAMDE